MNIFIKGKEVKRKMKKGFRKVILSVSLGSLLLLSLYAFPQAEAPKAASPAKEGYVGADTCKTCHEDRYASYSASRHGKKADPNSPAAKEECETCHGPGAKHAEAGGGKGVGGIIPLNPKATPVAKINGTCLNCHEKGKQVLWQGSTHENRSLACSTCHDPHGGNKKLLAKPKQYEVCGDCHKQIRAQMLRPSHHPIREGKLECTNCHNPHGTVTPKLLTANSPNDKCYECHTEKRGPFLWEHAPVMESCLNCHTPHGSSHDKLLVNKRPYLCQSCHSNSRHPGTLYDSINTFRGSSPSSRLFARACQNCHSQIHGSNHPSGKTFAR